MFYVHYPLQSTSKWFSTYCTYCLPTAFCPFVFGTELELHIEPDHELLWGMLTYG